MNMGFYGLRKFGRFVRRLFIWIPILWKQEDWDYAYIYPFLKQKLQELKNAYKKMIYTLIATNMQSDFDEAGFKNDKIVYYEENEKYDNFVIDNNDILLAMTGGTVGKSYFVQDLNQKMYVNQRVADIKISNIINSKYVNYLILSPLTQDKITSCKNSTNDNISIQDIKEFYVPLPPLAEQHRIVEKLEEILPLVDEYGKNEEKLSNISFYQSTFIREENNNCYKFIKGKVIYKLGEQQKLIEIHFYPVIIKSFVPVVLKS